MAAFAANASWTPVNIIMNFHWNSLLYLLRIQLCWILKVYLGTFHKTNPHKTRRIVNEKEVDNANLVRGIIEILGLGIIFLTADVFVTYKRRQNPISLEDVIELATDWNFFKNN